MMDEVDVVIVGAGPAGLALAADLQRRGLEVALVDENAARRSGSRAVVLHARTLELLEPFGLASGLVAAGETLSGATVWAGSEPIVRLDFDELGSRFAHLLVVTQAELEGALASALEGAGGRVLRETRLERFRQDGTGVTATLRDPSGERTLRAGWLVGADGAESTVREALEVPMESRGEALSVLVADVSLEWDLRDDRLNGFVGETGIVSALPTKGGRHRVLATLPSAPEASSEAPTLDDLSTLFALQASVNAKLSDARAIERRDVRLRQAGSYRDDRVFLVGDAAHVQDAFLAQGLNTGIQDALNLGWKLALVHRGDARASLLDTYDEERRRVGAALVEGAEAALRVLNVKSASIKAMREPLGRFLGSIEALQQRVARELSELSVGYERSSIVHEDKTSLLNARLGSAAGGDTPTIASVREFAAGPSAGQRAPDARASVAGQSGTKRLYEVLDAKRHALLLFDGRSSTAEGYDRFRAIVLDVRAAYGELVAPWVVTPRSARPEGLPAEVPVLLDPDGELEQRYAASTECVYLLRPDLYVGYRSQPADGAALLRFLGRILRKVS